MNTSWLDGDRRLGAEPAVRDGGDPWEWLKAERPSPRAGADPGHKAYRAGTHRTVAPAETLARVRPLMPAMGITRIANITGLDRVGIPVVMVCRPNSRSIAVSQGKGLTLEAAKASGLMEAVETFHAETTARPLILRTARELDRSHPLANIDQLPRAMASRFDLDEPILWIEGDDLLGGSSRWLPYEFVHTDYTLPPGPASGCFPANTNGLASGNHLLEAVSHGICEVIERDATTLWMQGGERFRRGRVLRLESVDDGACRDLLERFARAGVTVRVWDTTSDVGVASFYCLVMGRDDRFADPEFGSGCHPARQVALLRALTEAAQARTTYIAGSRDDFARDDYSVAGRSHRRRLCRMLMDAGGEERDFRHVPSRESDTLRGDVEWVLRRLRSAGIQQVLVVDLTQPEFGLPVVRVVIPGLEGPDKGGRGDYVPGPRAQAVRRGGP
jgi:ribosomal protein S12 methylthiotransferase accessory factor